MKNNVSKCLATPSSPARPGPAQLGPTRVWIPPKKKKKKKKDIFINVHH